MSPTLSEARQRERIPVEVHPDADTASRVIAAEIAALVRANDAAGRPTTLGLATGSTPVRLYRELIRLHREEGLSFRRVVTFNLDEYYGLPRTHPESYWRFMHEQLFDHVDLPPANIHLPSGTTARAEVFAACSAYEDAIRAAGGLDLQILGIGRTGHIGFNEPGSGAESRTRLVTLDALTRHDAARDFLGEANVPRHAITMGVGTVLAARRIILMAWGEAKASVVARAVEHASGESLPASLLQGHPSVRFVIDESAAVELTRFKHPWLVGPVGWTPALIKRATVWLAARAGKPVLKLVDEDYTENGMAELLTEHGPAYDLNIRIFNELQHTITGWPGGKPDADDRHRPERAQPYPKRVVVFTPEPSDEGLGMGGTLQRLARQGHAVTVVHLTSGSLAVPDDEVKIALGLSLAVACQHNAPAAPFVHEVRAQLDAKSAHGDDPPAVRRFKGRLRREEAKAALKISGIGPDAVRFLDLPFYENGRYRQFRSTTADVTQIVAVLRELQPHQIFATGRQDDPNSVASVSLELLRAALRETAGDAWQRDCRGWLYRPPAKAWAAEEIDMAVPLSPRELSDKIRAAFHHKSQRSQSPTGAAQPESWQVAAAANRQLAEHYDALGLAEYEAIEAFARWHP
ncbi:MAG TPA: glucosamine-6-phosphate deaminase [Opitutaceae bacterium]|nr:glucosamine-6-phosphate deaminase [Opitutaceae bacterium]